MQEYSRQKSLPGMKLFYEHPPLGQGGVLLPEEAGESRGHRRDPAETAGRSHRPFCVCKKRAEAGFLDEWQPALSMQHPVVIVFSIFHRGHVHKLPELPVEGRYGGIPALSGYGKHGILGGGKNAAGMLDAELMEKLRGRYPVYGGKAAAQMAVADITQTAQDGDRELLGIVTQHVHDRRLDLL